MNLSLLYNIDETRTELYKQEITVPVADKDTGLCKVYLDHIPMLDTLIIAGLNLVITEATNPPQGFAYYDYREEYDYVGARGIVYLNPADADNPENPFKVEYIPVASRVDARVINSLIEFGNYADGNIYTIDELTGPAAKEGLIDWKAIKGKPTTDTESSAASGGYLLSFEDREKLAHIFNTEENPAIGSIIIGEEELKPDTWAGGIKFFSSATITPEFMYDLDTGNINGVLFEANVNSILAPVKPYIDALGGYVNADYDAEAPSAENFFVLNDDPRLSDERTPLAHRHSAEDINGVDTGSVSLGADVRRRSKIGHTHSLSDISDLLEITNMPELRGRAGRDGANGLDGKDGRDGVDGERGSDGGYWIPKIDPQGMLSWEPSDPETMWDTIQPVNIMGPQGDPGESAESTDNLVRIKDIYKNWTPEGLEQSFTLLKPTTITYSPGIAYIAGNHLEVEEPFDVCFSNRLMLTNKLATDSRAELALNYDDSLATNDFALPFAKYEIQVNKNADGKVCLTGRTFTTVSSFETHTITTSDTDVLYLEGVTFRPVINEYVTDGDIFTYQVQGATDTVSGVVLFYANEAADNVHNVFKKYIVVYQDTYLRMNGIIINDLTYIKDALTSYNWYPASLLGTAYSATQLGAIDLQVRFPNYIINPISTLEMVTFVPSEWEEDPDKVDGYKLKLNIENRVPIGWVYKLTTRGTWISVMIDMEIDQAHKNITLYSVEKFSGCMAVGSVLNYSKFTLI